jgi:hypothetical protein
MSEFPFDCKIDWEQFEKVVGQQATLLKEHCDSFLVLLKMMDKRELKFNELCSMFSDDFLFDYYFSEDTLEDLSLFHDKVKELKEEFNKCIEIFQEKTNVQIYVDTSFLHTYIGEDIKSYLCLDVLEPTSKGFIYQEGAEEKLEELKKQGIKFEITDKVVKENA